MKYLATSILALSFILSAGAAQALAVNVGGTSSTGVGLSSGEIGIDANVSGNANADMNTSSSSGSSSASGAATTNAAVTVGPISITRADISADTAPSATVHSAAQVQSNSDLSAYAKSVVQADPNVSAAMVSQTNVSLGYAQPAKLFGMFPISIDATVSVDSSGNTTVSYPWYAFLTNADSASLKSDVRAAVQPTISANGSGQTTFSASEQAQLLAAMHDAVKSNLGASAAADATAHVSAQ
jgi:hypothetical protein